MTADMIFVALAGLALVLHGAALVWRRAMPALNAGCAAMILGHLASRLGSILAPPADGLLLGIMVFEALVILLARLALRGNDLARRLSWLAFGLHAAAAGAALAFALSFHLDRLF
jgi:hypothetical protein